MGEEIVFTTRLTPDDWDPNIRAWRCPAVDIPSAFIKTAYDPKGQLLAGDYLKIDKGPARVSWKGPDKHPAQIVLVLALGEELSPVSAELFWKRLAIVVPIIAALISAGATWFGKPDPTPRAHMLRLRVDPNDVEASGLPPAKITLNNQEVRQPIDHEMKTDVMAIIDVSKAFDLAKTLGAAYKKQASAVESSIGNINAVFGQLNDLTSYMNGDICSGGAHGEPVVNRGAINTRAAAISDRLRGVNSDLQRALVNGVAVPK
jgi:hypothetical protein